MSYIAYYIKNGMCTLKNLKLILESYEYFARNKNVKSYLKKYVYV